MSFRDKTGPYYEEKKRQYDRLREEFPHLPDYGALVDAYHNQPNNEINTCCPGKGATKADYVRRGDNWWQCDYCGRRFER